MTVSQSYAINGYSFTITTGAGHIDGITVPPDADLDDPEYINVLQIAQQLYPDFEEYGYCGNRYEIYKPHYREMPHGLRNLREEFVQMLVDDSIDIRQDYLAQQERYEPQKKKRKAGYIYLVKAITPDNHYKIGLSKNPVSRIDSMGVQLPFPIDTIHQFPTDDMSTAESYLHNKFADKRLNGEWFELSQEDVEYICSIENWTVEAIS